MTWPTLRANEQQSTWHSVDKHSLGPRVRVIRVGLSALQLLPLNTHLQTFRCIALSDTTGHVWTVPAVQEESDFSAKRSGAAMYPACFRVEACPVAMRPQWPLALM